MCLQEIVYGVGWMDSWMITQTIFFLNPPLYLLTLDNINGMIYLELFTFHRFIMCKSSECLLSSYLPIFWNFLLLVLLSVFPAGTLQAQCALNQTTD